MLDLRGLLEFPFTETLEQELWDEAEGPEGTHTGTDGTCEVHTERTQARRSNL